MAEEYDIIFDQERGFLGRNSDQNIESLIASIINYAKHKKGIYEQNSPEKDLNIIQQSLRSSLSLLQEQTTNKDDMLMSDPRSAGAIKDKIVEQNGQKYISTIENIAKFRAKVAANDKLLQKYCIEYPKNPAELRRELKQKITDAVNNLRKEISGSSPQIVAYRRMVEEIVVKFASSWGSFKNSYVLNYCLRGGAGVGKTTFAKAVAKCISAYGILATDYIKLADKTDFIAQYIGQTVYKTSNTLYSSIEGVCFIDEAYALGQTHSYGAEFIDELTLFTQKFPGCICIIVAGYEKEMKKYFFDMNEGLYRRFPNNLELRPYDILTINGAIVDKIASKLEITDKDSVTRATYGHQGLVSYLYMDTSLQFDTDPTTFNLRPFLFAIRVSRTVEKRNILKAFILKVLMGIPEGDLLPNQMGDVQNIVDKILMTQSIIQTGTVTYKDAMENVNAFLAIRDVAKFYFVPSTQITHLTTNGTSPTMFHANVIMPFIERIFGSDKNYQNIVKNPTAVGMEAAVMKNLDKMYTEAVMYLFDYVKALDAGRESIKLSTHVDIKFLQQEAMTLQTMMKINPDALLSYRDAIEQTSEKDTLNNLAKTAIGTIIIPKAKTIGESCEAGVPVVATPDPANTDGALSRPPNERTRYSSMSYPEQEPTADTTVAGPDTGDFKGFRFNPLTTSPGPQPRPATPGQPAVTTGDWITYTHQVTGQPYYYNRKTGETTWVNPAEPPVTKTLLDQIVDSDFVERFDPVTNRRRLYNRRTGQWAGGTRHKKRSSAHETYRANRKRLHTTYRTKRSN